MRISYGSELLDSGRHGLVRGTPVTMATHSEYVGRGFAMKKAPVSNHIRHPMLLHEACALVPLQGHLGIPNAVAWVRSQSFGYLVMERLDRNLEGTGFMQNWGSSRGCGEPIRAEDVFGDEFAVVKESLEFINTPSDYSQGPCAYERLAPPEEVKNAQSDFHRI